MFTATSSIIDTTFLTVFGIITLISIGLLVFLLINKIDQVKELKKVIKSLKISFDSLDEQSKLILKTDLELNRAQAELDKRLTSLDALQRTSRLISTTLDEDEIFRRLDKSLMFELGFNKTLVLTFDKHKILHMRVNTGFSKEAIENIKEQLIKNPIFQSVFKEGYPFSSTNSSIEKKQKASELFQTENFILSPILTQGGVIGVIFFGNQSLHEPISEADEEMASILTSQIGQSLENAQLFEEVYRSGQELELKIQDRTKQLAMALEKVQKISKTKSEFVSAVSHELRTPLTSIKGYASILLSGKLGEIPDKAKERLEKINIHSDSLVALINDLLDISRIESGRVEMSFSKTNIKGLVENVIDLLTPQIKEKNIKTLIDIAQDTPWISIDKKQIERVLINLLSNAIKYAPDGTIKIVISHNNKAVLCQVQDTGSGIKQDDLSRIFDEFYRVENELNENIKGTGLGLSLVRNIIKAHHGKIWATSEINVGTTFHFTLPLDPAEENINTKNSLETCRYENDHEKIKNRNSG